MFTEIQVFQDEIARLKSENARLKAENAHLKSDNAHLTGDNARLQGHLHEAKSKSKKNLNNHIDHLQSTNNTLLMENRWLHQELTRISCAFNNMCQQYNFLYQHYQKITQWVMQIMQ